jgi:hypothetical protein
MGQQRGRGGHKPYRKHVRKLVTTRVVNSPDGDFSDALFLVNNPSWTWRDLQETPAKIVLLVKAIQDGRAKVAEARRSKEN